MMKIKPMNRKKTAIALMFATIMVFSGIGIVTFETLGQWNPIQQHNTASTIISPDLGAGSGTTETFTNSDGNEVTLTSNAETFDVGQTITWTGSVYQKDPNVTVDAQLFYGTFFGNAVQIASLTTDNINGNYTEDWHTSHTFRSNGSRIWLVGIYDTGASSSASITINNDPSIAASSSLKTANTGQLVTFSSSSSGGTAPYSYQWYLNGAPVPGETSSSWSTTFNSTGTKQVYVNLTDAAGYSVNSNTINETVYPAPTFSVSSTPSPSDSGQSVDFYTSTSGGSGNYSYSYVLYDGTSVSDPELTSGSTSSFSYIFSITGTFMVWYSTTDSVGFSMVKYLNQTVNPDPTVSVSSSQDPTDAGNPVKFISSISGGTPGYSYSWSANGNTYTSQDINVSFSSSGSYSVDLIVTDGAGYSTSAIYTETVNSDPTVSASSNVSSADVNYPIEFSSTPSGGTGSYTYSWTLNGNKISTSQDFSKAFSSSGSYTLTVTITDSVGYSSSATVSVIINPNPSVSISSSENPADIGNSVTFKSSLSGGSGTDTYEWTINGAQVSTASEFSYSFSSTGMHYVNLTVTDSDEHTAYYSLQETVNPDPSLIIHVTHNPTDVGVWVNFSSTISGGTGPFSYSWSINGETFTSMSVNYTFTSPGTYPVSLQITDANGNTVSTSVNEVVNPDPTASIEAQYSTVDEGINDTLYADISGGTSPFNFTWSLGNTILNYSQEFNMEFPATGSYAINLTVVDSLGEESYASYTVIVVKKPTALIEGPNDTDVSTTTFWEGYGSYGTAPYSYFWFVNGINTSSGLYLEYSFPTSGKYNISLLIDDDQGYKAYAYLNVTVRDKPSVKILESVSATDVGIPVHFTSVISGGTPFFSYTWSISGIGIGGYQDNLTYIFSQPGTYKISLTAYDGSGNIATSSIEIMINSLPHVRIEPEYSNIDPNVTDSFNSNTSGGTPGFNYAWYISGSLSGNGSSLIWQFSDSGVYSVKLVVTDSQGETDSYSTDITVASYPEASIISSSNDTDANVSDHFRASGIGGIGPYQYEWIIAGHEFLNSTVDYAFRSSGNYSVQLVISDSFGKDASSSITVNVHPDPIVTVSWSGKPIVSKPFQFLANISGGIAPYQVSWIFPSGQHEIGTSISHVFSSSGPDTVEVQVSDQGGYTDTRNFTVNVGLYVAIAANQTSGLGPLAVQFSSSVLGGSGYSYNWTFSPGHYSLLQNPVYTFPVGNYTVHFTVTSSNGATGHANLSIQSLPPPVTFHYSTKLNITQSFHFIAIPNWDASTPYNMSWSFPNGQTLTGMNISYRFPVYNELNTVIATFSYGNGKTWSRDLTVRMIPATPSVTFSPPSIIPVDTMLSLNATASAPDSSTFTYSWDINGTSYAGQNQLYYFYNAGNYSVSVTATDGLGSSATVQKTIEVLPQGTNSSIAISYTKNTVGPMSYLTVKVQSTDGIVAMEAFLDTTELTTTEINSTYTHSGELAYFNLTMDQRDYSAGTYGIQIVVFNNNSASNHLTIPFAVSSTYSSSSFNLGDLISFFGGISNFLITMLTLGGLVIAWATLRRTDNPDVTIVEGSGKGAKRIQLKGRKVK